MVHIVSSSTVLISIHILECRYRPFLTVATFSSPNLNKPQGCGSNPFEKQSSQRRDLINILACISFSVTLSKSGFGLSRESIYIP